MEEKSLYANGISSLNRETRNLPQKHGKRFTWYGLPASPWSFVIFTGRRKNFCSPGKRLSYVRRESVQSNLGEEDIEGKQFLFAQMFPCISAAQQGW